METYTFLRGFADSWALLFMFLLFVGIIVWAFWPGQKKEREEAGQIPFRHENRPASREVEGTPQMKERANG